MANIASQKKRNRQNEVRRQRNKSVRSEIKTRMKAARTALDAGGGDAPDRVRAAQRRLGKAAAQGRLHKKTAARRTSRLMRSGSST